MKKIVFICGVFLLAIGFVYCSSDDDSGSSNALSSAFPQDLAVASPYAESSGSSSSSKFSAKETEVSYASIAPEDMESADAKAAKMKAMLSPSSIKDCAFLFDFFKAPYNPQCYGPTLAFTNHPDAGPGDPNANGELPPGDLGIWEEYESLSVSGSTEQVPCVVAKMNELIANVEDRIDFSIYVVSWMMCVAKVKGEDALPAAGETKDYTSLLQESASDTGVPFSVTSATIERKEDCEGHPRYLSKLQGTVTQDGKSVQIEVNMLHTQENADNTVYSGIIWSTFKGTFGSDPNCSGGNTAMFAASIRYQRLSAGNLLAEVETAAYCSSSFDPFTSDHRLDMNDKYDAVTNPEGWSNNYNYFLINHNTTSKSDVYVYKWQAGRMDSHARIFSGSVEQDASGSLSGCSYFGYGALKASADMADRMICNWAGPGNDHTGVSKVQRQCVVEDSTGKLVSDATKLNISYAPVNSCSYDGTGTATFGGSGAAIPDDLLNLDQVSFTGPSLPDVCE